MKYKGFTDRSLARVSKLSKSSIADYMTGKNRPGNYMRILAICIGMQLSFDESKLLLLYGRCETELSRLTEEERVHYSCIVKTDLMSLDGWNTYFKSRNFSPLITNPNNKSREPEN